ncbi:murein hydrolase activator EnvC family protein [Anaerosinus massiliensis]|uniref:murein hydrolase activator EnvC family protein n=1 Tax=Massilibacillus massiliensis TaxID=1806837 RepID=UPI000AE68EE0|nr:M23 family metallopeptidase [Massilibacillus massiliensis]
MKNLKRYCTTLTLLCFVGSFSLTVFANSLDNKLNEIQTQMSDQKGKVDDAKKQVDSVSEQLRVLQQDLQTATDEYKAVKKQLNDTEEKIEENKEILAKAEKDLAKRMKILNKRIRDIYENGQISYVDVLFGAKDFNDFMTRMDLLKRVIKHDYDLITKIQSERALILDKKAELERDQATLKELEKAAEEKRKLVEASKEKKEKVLDQAVNDRDTAERAYQELLEASKQVEQMIRQSRYPISGGQGSGKSTGSMIWPIDGPITSEYGWRTHPIFGTSKYHSGIDIGGDYGMPVHAADGGVVIYAGWISGYGNAVIIDHGNSVSSLYGHNESLAVSEGQSVSQGQVIAYCGSTGYSTGPHVHFEVRENGSPVSPYNYLR